MTVSKQWYTDAVRGCLCNNKFRIIPDSSILRTTDVMTGLSVCVYTVLCLLFLY